MSKAKRDEAAVREDWIQRRLGERKYRQLRMHLNGALRLLVELALVNEGRAPNTIAAKAPDLKSETTQGDGGSHRAPAGCVSRAPRDSHSRTPAGDEPETREAAMIA
jgi:hypothetical protein